MFTFVRRRFGLSARRFPAVGIAVVATALILAVSSCSSPQSSADRDVIGTLRIGVIGSTNVLTGPVGYANSRGELLEALKPLGVDAIAIFNFPNGPDLNQALVGGRLDVAQYGDTPALVARGSDLQTRLIAFTQFNLNAGVVVKDPSITSLKGLAGKRIGVPKGSYIDRYLQGALQEEGVTANLIHLYPADQEAPLSSGEIDAATLPDVIPSVNLQLFLRKGFRLIDSVYNNHPTLAGTSVSVSSADFLAKHSDFTPVWRTLLSNSVAYAKAHWEDYLNFETSNSKAPADALRAAANPDGFSTDAYPTSAVKLLAGTKAFLVAQRSIKKDFNLDSWYAQPAPSKAAQP